MPFGLTPKFATFVCTIAPGSISIYAEQPGPEHLSSRPFINCSLSIRVIPIMKTSYILAIIVSVAALAACGKKEEMPAPAAAPAAAVEAVKDAASAATDAVATAATDAASAAAGTVANAASAATAAPVRIARLAGCE